MYLACKSISSIYVIVDSNTNNHGDNNKVDSLGDIAFIHDRNDVIGFRIVFLNEDNVQKNIPNKSIKKVKSNNPNNIEPL